MEITEKISGSALSAAMALLALAGGSPAMAWEGEEDGPEFYEGLDGLSIGGLWYLSWQDGESDGESYSQMKVKRGYINVKKKILEWNNGTLFEGRITPDVHQDDSGDANLRLKYAYGKFSWKGVDWQPWLEFGMVHMPWMDFEEHINFYRMQDTMFVERNGTFNSADFGFTFGGFFGGPLDGVKYYPGRYGSFAVGAYNGGGYHALEKNDDKVFEGRVTLRPFPDDELTRGLQVSLLGITGKGNTAEEPEWSVGQGMLSYEHPRGVVTATYYTGKGNQKGTAVEEATGDSLDREGWSIFGELYLPTKHDLSLIGRYDVFDFDTSASDDEQARVIAGVAWDMGHHNTLLLDYETVAYDMADTPDDHRLQLTLQVKF